MKWFTISKSVYIPLSENKEKRAEIVWFGFSPPRGAFRLKTTLHIGGGGLMLMVDIQSFRDKIQNFRGKIQSFRGKIQSFRGKIQSFRGRIQSFRGKIQSFRGKKQSLSQRTRL